MTKSFLKYCSPAQQVSEVWSGNQKEVEPKKNGKTEVPQSRRNNLNADKAHIPIGKPIVFVAMLVLSIICANKVDAQVVIDSGTCGANLTWRLTSDSVLIISGSGAMTNYTTAASSPWYSNRLRIKNIIIGGTVTSIGKYAFYGTSRLKSITIPNSVISIGSFAFVYDSLLVSITIPNSVTSIEQYTFYNCRGLASIIIPNSVTTIADYAFWSCSSLTSVTIGNSVTSIGTYAFRDCSSLTAVTIPNSVTSIGDYAFANCSSLICINSLATVPPTITAMTFSDYSVLLRVPSGSLNAYQTANYWSNFLYVPEQLWDILDSLEDVVTDLQNDTANYLSQIANLQNDTANLNSQILALQSNISTLNSQINQLTSDLADCNGDLSDCGDELLILSALADSLQTELDDCLASRGVGSVSKENAIQLYPNPASSELKIKNYQLKDGENVEIIDVLGRVQQSSIINQQSEIIVDVSYLPQGMYFIKIGNWRGKFVVN